MWQPETGSVDEMARVLQDQRARASVNVQDSGGKTALHHACDSGEVETAALRVNLLLQANADPLISNKQGLMPLALLRHQYPTRHAAIALLEQFPEAQKDAEKTSLLVKARRLAVAASTSNAVAPSCLQGRVASGVPLPRVALVPLMMDEQGEDEEGEGGRTLRPTLTFMCGLGREAMPRNVFRVVMDLLIPSWDPLRRKITCTGLPALQG
jgi:hypothetical protein